MVLLDTDVFVDILRQHGSAVTWLRSLGPETIGVLGLVAMELLQGCRSREQQQQVETALAPYILYWPTQVDCARAYGEFAAYYLSHGLGVLDALIAETAVGLGVTLATFNEKHYGVLDSLQTVQPYSRG